MTLAKVCMAVGIAGILIFFPWLVFLFLIGYALNVLEEEEVIRPW